MQNPSDSPLEPPDNNSKIFRLLFVLENVFRELIVDKMETVYGPYWYKQVLPGGNILTKYRESRNFEKATPWSQQTAHHPIYYLDFPDLATIIERKDNWEKVFKQIFQRKDIFIPTLRELEPIRNKIAHNRFATERDLDIVQTASNKCWTYLGAQYLEHLANRAESTLDILEIIRRLVVDLHYSYEACSNYRRLAAVPTWETVETAWWFDSDYLGEETSSVREYFTLIREYIALPRSRGCGHKIELWVGKSNVETLHTQAFDVLDKISRSTT